ncbi:MAG: tRNA (adenine(22)-N(1))-methyltransferase TrmK [Lachnospiraceae bacterium]|nr:tRNA (adenine(22)-N(1))-methyltransferase TrmK [Lachnospiraceae bacterium]
MKNSKESSVIKLSQRLEMSVRMVEKAECVADVGCDHAHTDIRLLSDGTVDRCIAMDVRTGPLEKAAGNLELYGYTENVELRLSDGLDALRPGEVEYVIIAGMGGVVMKNILERGLGAKGHLRDDKPVLVLQPQSHIYDVRKWLYENGYVITDEDMCLEDGKYYFAIKAEPAGDEGGKPVQNRPGGYTVSEKELEFGPVLLSGNNELFPEYLDGARRKALRKIRQIRRSQDFSETGREDEKTSRAGQKVQYFQNLLEMTGGIGVDNFKAKIKGLELEYAKGTELKEIAEEFQKDYEHAIILGLVNGELAELSKTISADCEIDFVTVSETPGIATYNRGMILLMLKAFSNVFDAGQIRKITVDHTLGTAVYCSVYSDLKMTQAYLNDVKADMVRMVNEDLPITKKSMRTVDARDLFGEAGMMDKEELFKFRRVSNTNVYDLDGYTDYFYGYMPPSTGILKYFDLMPYSDGFLMLLPDRKEPEKVAPYVDRPKLFATQHAANVWGENVGIATVGDLNTAITTGSISDMILVQEAFQEKKIADIAEKIKDRGDVKFAMIAGPSSSGKTTFSHRLSIQLRTLGMKPHPIALDNYFKNREDTPKDEDGNYNFEILEAIDVEGFNNDMTHLLRGEKVELPVFNFKTGKREYKGNTLQLGPDDILVIEGIHGLNDKLSYSLPKESKFRIYISALTQLNIDEHNRMPTTDGRLIRRMVRDARTRGTLAKDTIAMWPSVRRGEEENIFPFQEGADVMFNSALVYELAVLKQFAEPLLFGIPESDPSFMEAKRLLKFLDYFLGISSEDIPKNSIVREFVGGSLFPV